MFCRNTMATIVCCYGIPRVPVHQRQMKKSVWNIKWKFRRQTTFSLAKRNTSLYMCVFSVKSADLCLVKLVNLPITASGSDCCKLSVGYLHYESSHQWCRVIVSDTEKPHLFSPQHIIDWFILPLKGKIYPEENKNALMFCITPQSLLNDWNEFISSGLGTHTNWCAVVCAQLCCGCAWLVMCSGVGGGDQRLQLGRFYSYDDHCIYFLFTQLT